jgi:hypothetical protein
MEFPHCFVPIGSREKVQALALTGQQVMDVVKGKLLAEINLTNIASTLRFYNFTDAYLDGIVSVSVLTWRKI